MTDAPTRSKNETLKESSRYLRGTIAEGLTETVTGALSEDDTQLTKFHGFYQQDDRDLRPERRKKKLEKAFSFMIRVRVPGGVATSAQWLEMDRIADTFANGTLKLTTRQAFQFHGVIKTNLKRTIKAINDSLLDTLAACGDVNRNVMCNPNPYQSRAHAVSLKLARDLSEHLSPRTRAYHEIWLDDEKIYDGREAVTEEEEPIYGKHYLPRKFKIVVAVPPSNDVDVFAHDLGYIAIVEVERRAERRWLGLSWLARPQAAGWAWGAALGTVAATLGLLATRGPVMPRTAGVSSPPPAQVQAPLPATNPSVRKDTGRKLAAGLGKKPAPRIAAAAVTPVPLVGPDLPSATATTRVIVGAEKPSAQHVVRPSSSSVRRVQTARRPGSPTPSPRFTPAPSPRPASGAGRYETSPRDMPPVVRSEQAPPPSPSPSDPPPPEGWPDTDGMTQMASGMAEAPSPVAASDDLVELRRQLLERPLHVPELGALKPTSSSPASRDGWIRF
jgi:hypothetical protein